MNLLTLVMSACSISRSSGAQQDLKLRRRKHVRMGNKADHTFAVGPQGCSEHSRAYYESTRKACLAPTAPRIFAPGRCRCCTSRLAGPNGGGDGSGIDDERDGRVAARDEMWMRLRIALSSTSLLAHMQERIQWYWIYNKGKKPVSCVSLAVGEGFPLLAMYPVACDNPVIVREGTAKENQRNFAYHQTDSRVLRSILLSTLHSRLIPG